MSSPRLDYGSRNRMPQETRRRPRLARTVQRIQRAEHLAAERPVPRLQSERAAPERGAQWLSLGRTGLLAQLGVAQEGKADVAEVVWKDRKSTRLNSSH